MEKLPKIEKKENIETTIVLNFFRHGDRNKNIEGVDDEEDMQKNYLKGDANYIVKLNQKGREQAHEHQDENDNFNQSIAYGSPRMRASETAMRAMIGDNKDIGDPSNSYKEVLGELNKDIKVGSKVGVDEKLNYIIDQEEKTGILLVKAITKQEGMDWLVHESDKCALENNDSNTDTYSALAKNIALIIKKYYKASDRWSNISKDPEKSELSRYMGTHGMIVESFVSKVIEKIRGLEVRDDFLNSIGSNGFDFVEGPKITISNKNNNKEIVIEYQKIKEDGSYFMFNELVGSEILEEIIEEGQLLKEEIKKAPNES